MQENNKNSNPILDSLQPLHIQGQFSRANANRSKPVWLPRKYDKLTLTKTIKTLIPGFRLRKNFLTFLSNQAEVNGSIEKKEKRKTYYPQKFEFQLIGDEKLWPLDECLFRLSTAKILRDNVLREKILFPIYNNNNNNINIFHLLSK